MIAVAVATLGFAIPTAAHGASTVLPITPQTNPLLGIPASGEINGMSCVDPDECVAVGTDDGEPITLVGNPASWRPDEVHQVTLGSAFSSSGIFESVSCVSASDCVAVGYDSSAHVALPEPIVAIGNPSTWTAANVRQIVLGVRFGGGGQLNSVSCVSSSYCVAVGADDGAGGNDTAIDLTGSPQLWKESDVHQVLKSDVTGYNTSELLGVSCVAVRTCTAVGDTAGQPLVFSGSPSSWNTQHARVVIDHAHNLSGGSLAAVTCVSATQCVAVGMESLGAQPYPEPLVVSGDPESWTARDYRVMILDAQLGRVGELSAVACTSITWCDAVGSSNGSQPIDLAGDPATWDRSRIDQLPVPRALGGGASLNAVACFSLSCDALGADAEVSPQIVHLSGAPTSWKVDHRDALRLWGSEYSANADVESMSCPTITECVGVGVDSNQNGIVIVGNPLKWSTATATQLPQTTLLSSVSCPSPEDCVAVGVWNGGQPIVFTGNPLTWNARNGLVIRLGHLLGFGGGLDGVSCTTSTFCVAVGVDNNDPMHLGSGQPIEIAGNPATWSASKVIQFKLGSSEQWGGELFSVDCPSRRWCVAVGGSSAGEILVQQGNPSRVTPSSITQVIAPAWSAPYGSLTSVTCLTSTRCVGVGLGASPLVMVGNPRTWGSSATLKVYTVPSLPNSVHADDNSPAFSYDSVFGEPALESVGCLQGTVCAAVGADSSGAPIVITGPLASWHLTPAMRVSSTAFDSANVDSTACVATTCYLIGSSPLGPFVAPL